MIRSGFRFSRAARLALARIGRALPHARLVGCAGLCLLPGVTLAGSAGSPPSSDERPFFDELPVVLSVSRLAQPLRDAPGSVTVIDGEAIRASGARDLADLLRTVPGFLVAQSTGGAPLAVYHGVTDANPRGLQILVDGRSQYSPLFFGGVSWNLIDVPLDDIERIEVVRGANSAAYGSNAFLGVVNVVTRPAATTQGAGIRVAQGNDGVADRQARLGTRIADAFVRLSVERDHDDGVMNAIDARRTERANLRVDLPLGGSDQLQFQSGHVGVRLDAGQPGNTRDAPRPIDQAKEFVSAAWTRDTPDGGGASLRYTHSRERYSDFFIASDPALDRLAARLGLPSPYPVPIEQRIRTTRDEFEFQRTSILSEETRLVWGAGERRDRVLGEQLYSTRETLQQKVDRLFGNFEWRPARWVFNAGATWEHDSLSKTSLAPRLSANYHLTSEQTLRAAATRAQRIPTLTESRARSAYGAFDTANLGSSAGVVPVEITRRASGGLQPEQIDVREIGYLADFRAQRLFVDARAFRERIHDRIVPVTLALTPPDCELVGLIAHSCGQATDFLNGQAMTISGLEYALRWRPRARTELTLEQTFVAIRSHANASFRSRDPAAADLADRHMEHSAPKVATVLRWREQLPFGLDASITHYRYSQYQWTADSAVGASRRTDLRLAYPVRFGDTGGELALTVQGVGGRRAEYRDSAVGAASVTPEYLRSRGWLTLTLGM